MPNAGFNHTCLAVISLDSTLRKDENYYLQVILKERNNIDNEVIRHITEDVEISFDESDEK